jgi:hypothetical protein
MAWPGLASQVVIASVVVRERRIGRRLNLLGFGFVSQQAKNGFISHSNYFDMWQEQ